MKRWGKKRVSNCRCESNFTCRECLTAGVLIAEAVFDQPVPRDLNKKSDNLGVSAGVGIKRDQTDQ